MKNKKILSLLCCAIFIFSTLCSCGISDKLSVDEIHDELVRTAISDDTSVKLSDGQVENYFIFDKKAVSDYAVSLGDDENAYKTVAVFKAQNKTEREIVLHSIQLYLTNVTDAHNKATDLKQLDKLSGRLIYECGDFLILVITDEYTASTAYLKSIKAKPLK